MGVRPRASLRRIGGELTCGSAGVKVRAAEMLGVHPIAAPRRGRGDAISRIAARDGAVAPVRWTLVAVAVGAEMVVSGCTVNSDKALRDDLGSSAAASQTSATSSPDGGGPSPSAAGACVAPAEGCPCPAAGMQVQCLGPKIRMGNVTSCPPGVRVCQSGRWGACLGTAVHSGFAELKQDYESQCTSGTQVVWGMLSLQGVTPQDSTVGVGIQTAQTESALDDGSYSLVAGFDANSGFPWPAIDVGAALSALGRPSGPWLRVTVLLTPASGGAQPIATWQQDSSCSPP
jgi:hypothetical protein